MQKFIIVVLLAFFSPISPSFAVISTQLNQTTLTIKKTDEKPKNKKSGMWLSIGLGCLIGGFLVAKASPVVGAVALGIAAISFIVAIFYLIKEQNNN